MLVPNVPQMPSIRAQELGQKIAHVIQEYQQRNADLSATEVRDAMDVARGQTGPTGSGQAGRPMVAVAVGMVAAAGAGIAMLSRSGSIDIPANVWPMVGVGAMIVAVGIAVFQRRGRG